MNVRKAKKVLLSFVFVVFINLLRRVNRLVCQGESRFLTFLVTFSYIFFTRIHTAAIRRQTEAKSCGVFMNQRKTRIQSISGFLFFFFIITWGVFERDAFSLNVQTYNPYIGRGGSFRVSGAESLPKGELGFGLNFNFDKGPLTIQDITIGGVEREIVPWLFTQDLQVEAGLHRRFTLGMDIPLSLVKHLPVGGGTVTEKSYNIGDISLYGRMNLLSQENSPLCLALIPFVEIPSGSVDDFTGDEGLIMGIKAAVEKTIGRFNAAVNIGYRGRFDDNTVTQGAGVTPLTVGDEFTYGLGLSVALIKNRLDLVGDLYGATMISDFGTNRQASPLEALGGFRAHFLEDRIAWSVGAGTGLVSGYGSPDYRIVTGLTFRTHPFSQRREPVVGRPVSIYFDFDHAEISREARTFLDEQAAFLNKHPKSRLAVEGHTDSVGTVKYNQKLSEKRAGNALHYLKSKVDDDARMSVKGYGELKPKASNATAEGRAQNRRVDLLLVK